MCMLMCVMNKLRSLSPPSFNLLPPSLPYTSIFFVSPFCFPFLQIMFSTKLYLAYYACIHTCTDWKILLFP